MNPPIAKRIPHPHLLHGDVRSDDYYWLRDRNDPDVIRYLEEENQYYDHMMKPLEPLTKQLYNDMVSRIPPVDEEVPYQDGPFYYFSRTEKDQQYPVYLRIRARSRNELDGGHQELILDLNRMTTGSDFLSVTVQRVSPDHAKLAYLENRDGTDRYTLYIKNLSTGHLYPDRIDNVFLYGSVEWDATGEYIFYVTVDDTQRPYRLWRHRLGNLGPDTLLYEEADPSFSLTLDKSRSGQYLFFKCHNKASDEVWYLPANVATEEFRRFAARRRDIKYDLEHWGQNFVVLTNEGAENFTVKVCDVTEPHGELRQLIEYNPDRYIEAIHPFQDALILFGRQGGLTQIWVYRDDSLKMLAWPESLYNVWLGTNRQYDTTEVLIHYESFITPKTTWSLDLSTGELSILRSDPVPDDYHRDQYQQWRIWSPSADGVQIPVSLVYRKGALDNGPAPLILYGYGSYGMSIDPNFDAKRLPLLDRGVIFVMAHVRGGAEMGQGWYHDGKLLQKRHTFSDFIDVAKDLIRQGYTNPSRLAARGRSAGGLLMGAVLNMAPELFQVVVAGVPFVDVINTMLDDTIPLTSLEWDEWGNPMQSEYYGYMKSYSPYDNVEAKRYPHILAFTGLNDPRVGYWEPAKWVARLRVTKTDNHSLLLKTHMGAGHGGSSARYQRILELAEEYAFILDKIGLNK
ncbi:MAG: oligopeptidase B [Sulfobacillus benefaciens]|uniref:Oligopeptidase B n=1 Tax=Sulfobacillus benefaciens TaxID=453960 RepID=A0A2T2XEL8_9FIRM|nr:MAG: oligopeptidase B [Sulfobacillus benefaciens]